MSIRTVLPLLLLLHIILFSCCDESNRAENSVISIDIETAVSKHHKLWLSHYIDNIYYIPLERSDGNFLKGVYILRCVDSLLYVTDLTNCYLYKIDGSFIAKIGKLGRGPGEYQFISNIEFGYNQQLYIQSLTDIFEFNYDGHFLRKFHQLNIDHPWHIRCWRAVNDSLFFGLIPNFSGNEKSKGIVYNKLGDIKIQFINYLKFKPLKIEINNYADQGNIYSFNRKIHIKEHVNDTLFSLDSNLTLTPVYRFSLGSYSMPYTNYFQSEVMTYQYGYINNIFETHQYIFIDYWTCNDPSLKRQSPVYEDGFERLYYTHKILGIYDKNRKETKFLDVAKTENRLNRTGLYNDIDGGPRFYPDFYINESTLAMVIDTKALKEFILSDDFIHSQPIFPEKKTDLERFATKKRDTDNPILMLIKLKDANF